MAGFTCRVLGPLELAVGRTPIDLGGRKTRGLFAILLIERGRVVSSDRLIDELWGDAPPPSARHLVHVYVSNVRRALKDAGSPPGALETHEAGYGLLVEEEDVDAALFERLVKDAARLTAANDPLGAAAALGEALGLWRGSALTDFAYEPFAQPEIARLEELRLVALEDLVDAKLALGRHRELVAELQSRIREAPYRERLRGQLMVALYGSGRQAEALEVYRSAREALSSSLGIEPGPALQHLHRAILNHDPAVAPPPPLAQPGDQPGALAASRRLVTVVAVSPASLLSDHIDPEAKRAVIDTALADVRRMLEPLGASIHPSHPDFVIAAFGVPATHEDDAVRALTGAAEITSAWSGRDGHAAGLCIGIDSGELVADSAGIHGAAVSRAIRLSEAADPGEALIGETTFRLARHAVVTDEMPGGARRLITVLPDATPLPRRWDVPLVGRGDQLEALRGMFADVVAGDSSRLVTVLGEAGIGKSRLVREFAASIGADATTIVGRCVSHGEDAALRPFREIVRAAAGDLTPEAIAGVFPDTEHAARDAALIAAALGWGATPGVRDELFVALRRLVDAVRADAPCMLVFDDVHWAQPECLDAIAFIAGRSRRAPLLVLCLARPEFADERDSWMTSAGAERLLVQPLTAAESGELVTSLQTVGDLPAKVVARIVEAGDGNPFFLEQLCAMMTDTRRSPGDVTLPLTVRGLLSARLERLGPAERAALDRAAVVGKEFGVDLVRALLPTEARPQVPEHLRRMRRMAFLRDAADGPIDGTFRFQHDLTRDVVYASIPKALRASLHEQLAEALIAAGDDSSGGGGEIVGFHLEQAWLYTAELRAGSPVDRTLAERAAGYLWPAARRSAERGDMQTADTLYLRTEALLPEEPSGALLEEHSTVLVRDFRDFQRADGYLLEAARRASDAGNKPVELRARLGRLNIHVFSTTDDLETRVAPEARELLAAMREIDDHLGMTRAWQTLGFCSKTRSRYAETIPLLMQALPHARRSGDPLEETEIFCDLVDCLYDGPTPATEAIRQCSQILDEAPGPFNQLWTLSALAPLHAMAGQGDLARDVIARIDRIADDMEMAETLPYYAAIVRTRHYNAGRLLEDPQMMDAAVRGMPDEQLVTHSMLHTAVATARLKQGDGRDAAARVVSTTDPVNTPQGRWVSAQVRIRIDRAEALSLLGDNGHAAETAREAVALAATTDALNTHADALVALAKLTLGGDSEESPRALIERAVALWDAKGNDTMGQRGRAWLSRLRAT